MRQNSLDNATSRPDGMFYQILEMAKNILQ